MIFSQKKVESREFNPWLDFLDFVHALLYFIQSADSNLNPETIVKVWFRSFSKRYWHDLQAPSINSNPNEYEGWSHPNELKLDTTTENSSEMVKFLAFIRKMGMDLLWYIVFLISMLIVFRFPLLVQDKIMVAIYDGIKETKSCPHRGQRLNVDPLKPM